MIYLFDSSSNLSKSGHEDFYNKKLIAFESHILRLQRSVDAINITIDSKKAKSLNLEPMERKNSSLYETNFTISVDASKKHYHWNLSF